MGWGRIPEDVSQAEGCDQSVDEIEEVAEPLDETDSPEFPNDARN